MAHINQDCSGLRYDLLQIFNKKFEYQPWTNEHKLPDAVELFSQQYEYENLQELKEKLNDVKSRLNHFDIEEWSRHTKSRDPSSAIVARVKRQIKGEFVTVAWCKFYQCLCTFPQLVPHPHINTVHLCEAPGAFVAALNHYLHSHYAKEEIKWNWLATTLNPYYEGNTYNEMIDDDRFMFSTLDHWLFHADFTGNITDPKNQAYIADECRSRFTNNNPVLLITADGSVDCMERPDLQEEQVAILNLSEILTGLTILAPHGCFVIKMFTTYNASSVCKLFLLHCIFQRVYMYKPSASKGGNSEIYVVCVNYHKESANLPEILRGIRQNIALGRAQYPIFPSDVIPNNFLLQHEACCRFFMHYQINAIEKNILMYELNEVRKPYENYYIKRLRHMVSEEYCWRCSLTPISDEFKISQAEYPPLYRPVLHISYTEIQRNRSASNKYQLEELKIHVNRLRHCPTYPTIESQRIRMDEFTDIRNYKSVVFVYRGRPIKRLYSSLFVWKEVIEIGTKIQDIHPNVEPFIPQNAQVILDKEKKHIYYFERAPIILKDSNFSQLERKFFCNFLRAVIRFRPISIRFCRMPFITHFSVSILKYLSSYVFQSLTFKKRSDPYILLKGYRRKFKSTLAVLNDIVDISCNNKDKYDQEVLCLLNLKDLHHHDFNTNLVNFNNKLIIENLYDIIINMESYDF